MRKFKYIGAIIGPGFDSSAQLRYLRAKVLSLFANLYRNVLVISKFRGKVMVSYNTISFYTCSGAWVSFVVRAIVDDKVLPHSRQ